MLKRGTLHLNLTVSRYKHGHSAVVVQYDEPLQLITNPELKTPLVGCEPLGPSWRHVRPKPPLWRNTPPSPHLQITHWTRRARCVASRMGNHGTMPALRDFQWECSQPPYNSMSVTVSDLTVKTALPEGIQGNFWSPSSPPLLLILKHRTSWKSAVCSDDKRQPLADECDNLCLFEYFTNFLNIIASWMSPFQNMLILYCLRLLCFWKKIALYKDSQVTPACPSDKGSIKMKTNMNHWWNDTERGETKYSENILSQ